MSQDIDYGTLMHTAMRGLIQKVLTNVSENGLPGAHHFFITFDTRQDGVEIADWLRERYPEEMTVVMQHWFENLEVGDNGFAITLNFGDAPEPLYIPYDAIKTFVDPSVEFGLRFESPDDEDEVAAHIVEEAIEVEEPPAQQDADVVSLDSFRK
ncbi:SspB family protein [Ruegeria atlantica]|uniref:SspB family protein n=1 Tax=Ruegeria atlantica TaxID=81569 RepID=UPI00147AD2C2|nr:ClpXP protease specificity-enhancing factor SspB [Ruegeria atlantica]